MKKAGVNVILLLLVMSLFFGSVLAAVNTTNSTTKSVEDKALSCIMSKVVSGTTDNCASLSVEEQSLVALTTGKCVQSLTDKGNGDCWPGSNCDLKQTALATLALSSVKGEKWLTGKNMTSSDMNWFIQIDSDSETKCSASYDSKTYNFKIGKDKKIDSISGSCLKTARDGYWLSVDRSCIGKTFEISCNSTFTSNLIYSKKGEEKYYISSETQSGSENGKVEQLINSYCIGDRGKCDYEGTLWTSLVLSKNKKDIDSYLPYLVAFAEENSRYGSYAFLYLLTGFNEYYSLMQKSQKDSGYFDFGSPYKKHYDTAIAFLSISSSSSNEISKAKDWLTDTQDSNGCWSSLRDTALLLYTGWPGKAIVQPTTAAQTTQTCSSKGLFCLSSSECRSVSGTTQDYTCPGLAICCSKNLVVPSCSAKGGTICPSQTLCTGNVVASSDLGTCCVSGQCIPQETPKDSQCVSMGYSCRDGSSCFSNEEEKSSYSCDSNSQVCCGNITNAKTPSGGLAWWVWLLVVLIIIVIILIIWKLKKKSSSDGNVNKSRPPFGGMPPQTPLLRRPSPQAMNLQRPSASQATIPQRQQPQPRNPSVRDRELDETFKKLKDISK